MADFPQELLNAATSVYVMRGGNHSDEMILRESFQVSDQTILELHRQCTGPTKDGVNFLAIYKTKAGTITQILTNTAGALEMWAYSSTQQDTALRSALYDRIGSMAARSILAKEFPLGTAAAYIEAKERDATINDSKSVVQQIADKLARKYLAGTADQGVA